MYTDSLTFVAMGTMMIISLCGIVYISRQFLLFIRWACEMALKDWDKNDKKE